jgi:hypothetical protein
VTGSSESLLSLFPHIVTIMMTMEIQRAAVTMVKTITTYSDNNSIQFLVFMCRVNSY